MFYFCAVCSVAESGIDSITRFRKGKKPIVEQAKMTGRSIDDIGPSCTHHLSRNFPDLKSTQQYAWWRNYGQSRQIPALLIANARRSILRGE